MDELRGIVAPCRAYEPDVRPRSTVAMLSFKSTGILCHGLRRLVIRLMARENVNGPSSSTDSSFFVKCSCMF